MPESLQSAMRVLAGALEPLAEVLSLSDQTIIDYVERLGWTLPSVPPALKAVGTAAKAMADASVVLELNLSLKASGGAASVDIAAHYLNLAVKVEDVVSVLRNTPSALNAQLPAGFVSATDFPNRFVRRLIDVGLHQLMVRNTRRLEPILRLIGLVEVVKEEADPARFQPAYLRRTIRWDRLGRVLGDPVGLLADVYGLGHPDYDGRFCSTL